jgi:hypothetical protein
MVPAQRNRGNLRAAPARRSLKQEQSLSAARVLTKACNARQLPESLIARLC